MGGRYDITIDTTETSNTQKCALIANQKIMDADKRLENENIKVVALCTLLKTHGRCQLLQK